MLQQMENRQSEADMKIGNSGPLYIRTWGSHRPAGAKPKEGGETSSKYKSAATRKKEEK